MGFTRSMLPLAAVMLGCAAPAQAFSPVGALAPGLRMGVGSAHTASLTSACSPRPARNGLGPLKMVATAKKPDTITDTAQEFWTRPRTTNANWGVFFTLETKDSDIWISGLRCGGHSFASVDDYTRIKLECWTKEGDSSGAESDKSAWTEAANIQELTMPRVEVGDSRAVYTYVPFSKPVHVQKNSKQSFCVHTNKKTGLVVRRKINFGGDNPDPYFAEWREGVTDEGAHFKILAGKCPGEKLFVDVGSEANMRAFVGVIDYALKAP
eukprot:Tamp_23314.p1 GENE.Tamp_23314~~Tamp_23314.p1  ORF type:complete len:267 (-),score=54.92 Tamp_23314:175-975(-)